MTKVKLSWKEYFRRDEEERARREELLKELLDRYRNTDPAAPPQQPPN